MQTRFALHRWALLPLVSVISLALSATLPIDGISDWVMGLPGLVLFLVNILEMVLAYACASPCVSCSAMPAAGLEDKRPSLAL